MKLNKIDADFSVCKVIDYSQVNWDSDYCFIGKTDEEQSLVCLESDVPANLVACDNGWKAFRIQGVLDFSLIGILSNLSSLLAEHNIGIFAVSTYNTDYIFVKKEQFDKALALLSTAGYELV